MKIKAKIEIPKGSNVKYEINKVTGAIEVDRVLKLTLPYNYGFIPNTLWDDGDALDVIVLGDFVLHPGCEIVVTPVAVVKMFDGGVSDFKVVCVFDKAPEALNLLNAELPGVVNFLSSYKEGVTIEGTETDLEFVKKTVLKAADQSKINFWNEDV